MSGNIAGLASYNGTGTQGTAVVDSPEREGEIMSIIWNKNDTTRQLITGTALREITPGGIVSNTLNNTVTTFTIGNDIDVIGEMFLYFSANNKHDQLEPSTNFLFNLISKVEVLIGSQVWQTLSPSQLMTSVQMSMEAPIYFSVFNETTIGTSRYFNGVIPLLGMFTNTLSPANSNFTDQRNNGYLMAAASNQDMHIKVYWADGKGVYGNPADRLYDDTVNIEGCTMYCKQSTISNFEREQIRSMVLPKRVMMTQTVSQTIAINTATDISHTFNVNCDPLNIFASALAISLNKYNLSNLLGTNTKSSGCTVELFLNGSSYSGRISGEFLSWYGGHILNNLIGNDDIIIFPLANSINGSGVPLNRFDSIRVVIKIQSATFNFSSDRTDTLSVVAIGESTILYSGGAASLNKF